MHQMGLITFFTIALIENCGKIIFYLFMLSF